MPKLKSIQQYISPELEALEKRIHQQLESSSQLMNTVIDAYLQKKGKQIRPIIVLLTAKLVGEVNDNTLAAAAAVELLHNASLIHDDVVDNSKMRRGEPTINAVWDNHIAVLVGDFFVSSAMQQAIATGDIRVIDTLCFLGKMLSLGELDQIYNARYHYLTEESYFHVIEYKTASLFTACARMGCLSVGIDDERADMMAEFAKLLGLCFQIRDDIYDYCENDEIGKPTGNDLKEGKITLPLLYVLLCEGAPNHKEMLALAEKEELSDEEISLLTRYAIDNGGIDYAYDRMAQLRDKAMEVLSKFPVNQASKSLAQLLDIIVSR